MELSLAIREGVYEALSGNVIFDGSPLKVYDAFAFPPTASYPYILLSSQNNSQRNTKFVRPQDAGIIVEVVWGDLQPVGFKKAEELMEQVQNIINPNDRTQLDITSKGYRIGDTINVGGPNLTAKNAAYYVYRKLATFNFIVSTL